MQLVLVDDFFRNIGQFHLGIFWAFEWGHQVEIGDVSIGKSCPGRRDYAIQENFDKQQVSGWCSHVVRVIDEIATHGCSHSVRVLFSVLIWQTNLM